MVGMLFVDAICCYWAGGECGCIGFVGVGAVIALPHIIQLLLLDGCILLRFLPSSMPLLLFRSKQLTMITAIPTAVCVRYGDFAFFSFPITLWHTILFFVCRSKAIGPCVINTKILYNSNYFEIISAYESEQKGNAFPRNEERMDSPFRQKKKWHSL